MVKKRPAIVHGVTKRIQTGCGKLYVTLNRDDNGEPIEVFIRLGKAGGCASSQTESLGRLISIILRHGIGVEEVIKHLAGVGCHQPAFIGEGGRTLSCADAVSQALVKMMEISHPPKESVKESKPAVKPQNPKAEPEKEPRISKELWDHIGGTPCPDCGATLAYEEGCQKCMACGYTKC